VKEECFDLSLGCCAKSHCKAWLIIHSSHDNILHSPYKMDHLFQPGISMSVNCHFSLCDPIGFSKEFLKNMQ
jgi:hypothetical protein